MKIASFQLRDLFLIKLTELPIVIPGREPKLGTLFLLTTYDSERSFSKYSMIFFLERSLGLVLQLKRVG